MVSYANKFNCSIFSQIKFLLMTDVHQVFASKKSAICTSFSFLYIWCLKKCSQNKESLKVFRDLLAIVVQAGNLLPSSFLQYRLRNWTYKHAFSNKWPINQKESTVSGTTWQSTRSHACWSKMSLNHILQVICVKCAAILKKELEYVCMWTRNPVICNEFAYTAK